MSDYIKPGEAARMLNVSYPTIRSWCDRGILDYYPVLSPSGKQHYYVSRESVETFVDRMKSLAPNQDRPALPKRKATRFRPVSTGYVCKYLS